MVGKQGGGEGPEGGGGGRGQALDCEGGFVDERGGRVPGLDLLADYELEVGGQVGGGADVGDGGCGEGFEDF